MRDVGLGGGRAEVDVLRSLVSAWSEVPLVNEEGGSFFGVLVLGVVGVVFTGFDGDLITTGDGADLAEGGVTVG